MSFPQRHEPVTEFRTFHHVECGVIYGDNGDGARGTWLVLPDGKCIPVRQRAYASMDEAMAAEVAVWRIRRIRRGIDKPTTAAPTPIDFFDQIRARAHSETVTVECGEVNTNSGGKCFRQKGHAMSGDPLDEAHVGTILDPEGREFDNVWKKGGKRVIH